MLSYGGGWEKLSISRIYTYVVRPVYLAVGSLELIFLSIGPGRTSVLTSAKHRQVHCQTDSTSPKVNTPVNRRVRRRVGDAAGSKLSSSISNGPGNQISRKNDPIVCSASHGVTSTVHHPVCSLRGARLPCRMILWNVENAIR